MNLGSIRLLPITIFAISSLLAVKSAELVKAAVPTSDAGHSAASGAHSTAAFDAPSAIRTCGTTIARCWAAASH